MVGPPETILGAGFAFTVITSGCDSETQPLAFVIVTLYDPDAVTLMLLLVAPFDHIQLVPSLVERLTLLPWQNVLGPLKLIEEFGAAVTETVVAVDNVEHPLAFEAATVYEPLALTVMD